MFGKAKKQRQIIINSEKLETRVAFLNSGKLEEYKLERSDAASAPGSVYIGRIVNIETTLQAAFVDIGEDRNAFLPFREMLPATSDMAESIRNSDKNSTEKPQTPLSRRLDKIVSRIKNLKAKRLTEKDIPNLFPVGTEILLQIVKGPIGNKGPRGTMEISLAGRYIVLLPFADTIGLSRKIEDKKERTRLKQIMNELQIPKGFGCICRTNAEERKKVFLKRDLDTLLELWNRMETADIKPGYPALLYKEPTLLEKTVRDSLTEDIDEVVIDDKNGFAYVKTLMTRIAGSSITRKLTHYKKANPVFDAYNVEEQINSIFERVVHLDGGGYICIDETEALISIDVNTGVRKGKDHPETILHTNLAACVEIARHLRLRDIGGLVVVDFIDMRSQKDRDMVLKLMRKLVREDRAKSTVLPISRLGLMQMTRQREGESVLATVFDPCPYCEGKGKIESATTVSVHIQRRLKEILARHQRHRDLALRVFVHPSILARLKNEDNALITELENQYGHMLSFRADPALHHSKFRIIDPDTDTEF
ncbi:MAG: Rne/Rng family ribonuclease [Kiritimatiellaeota bacterium]|nr:Rne/Rng family ribonuclease [Kiritimatiellota bacterium]